MRGLQDKTIIKVISAKLNAWKNSITDEEIKKIIFKDTIVTGGCIASMCMGDPVKDFDIYFRTKESALAVAQYYINKVKKENHKFHISIINVGCEDIINIKGETESRVLINIQKLGRIDLGGNPLDEEDENINQLLEIEPETPEPNEKSKFSVSFVSENAITLTDKVQLVTRFYGEPDKIHSNYDFVHAMCYYDWAKNDLVIPVEAVRSMQSKTLIYRGSLYPICSIFRARKFMDRGWKIGAAQLLKMAIQVNDISNLLTLPVLKEQLTGVDYLYFKALIDALEQVPEDAINDGDIDSLYIMEIIERTLK